MLEKRILCQDNSRARARAAATIFLYIKNDIRTLRSNVKSFKNQLGVKKYNFI